MSQIRTIFRGAVPNFPATDQHPDAERFYVSAGKVLSETEWHVLVMAASAAAAVAVFGTDDAAAIEAALQGADEARGELKAQLESAAASDLPALDLVVDAIGAPSLEEIDAVLNPPPAPEPTVAEKLAAVGLTTAELKAALGL